MRYEWHHNITIDILVILYVAKFGAFSYLGNAWFNPDETMQYSYANAEPTLSSSLMKKGVYKAGMLVRSTWDWNMTDTILISSRR